MTNTKPAPGPAARIAWIALLAGGCSSLPDWSPQEARDFAVVVEYEGNGSSRAVPLPVSNPDLTVFELTSDPDDLPQSYSPTDRHLHLPAGSRPVHVFCRFRLFRRHDAQGHPLPWPEARDLFPGASRVRSGTDVGSGD